MPICFSTSIGNFVSIGTSFFIFLSWILVDQFTTSHYDLGMMLNVHLYLQLCVFLSNLTQQMVLKQNTNCFLSLLPLFFSPGTIVGDYVCLLLFQFVFLPQNLADQFIISHFVWMVMFNARIHLQWCVFRPPYWISDRDHL